MSAIAPPRLANPPSGLPIDAVRATVDSYHAGACTADELIRCVDRYGGFLEAAIARRLAVDVDDYRATVRQVELLASRITLGVAQRSWLRRFPHSAPDPGPVRCRLESGRLVRVEVVLESLHNLDLDWTELAK